MILRLMVEERRELYTKPVRESLEEETIQEN
jgi:hypothetical protein